MINSLSTSMTQQILSFLAQNPLYLGLGLLVGAALWLLMAALLSILMPASDDAESFDTGQSWESIPPAPKPQRYLPAYDGPQSISPERSAPIWFRPSEPSVPVFAQLRTFSSAPTPSDKSVPRLPSDELGPRLATTVAATANLAPVVVEEIPAAMPQLILKERLDSLADKLQALEQTTPDPALAHFDEKVSRLSESLSQIHHSIQSASMFEEQKNQLEEKFDNLSRRFIERLDQMADFESSPGAVAHPVEETVRREIESALANARREREERLRESESAQAEIARRLEESRQSEARAAQEIYEAIHAGEEAYKAKQRELEQERERLAQEKIDFETRKASEPPRISLSDLRNVQEALQARLAALKDQQERERARQEKLLARLRRRLAQWQAAWRTRLAGDQARWDAEWRTLEIQRGESLAKLAAERDQMQARLALLREEEAKLQAARDDFQRNVADVWSGEKNAQELEARRLADQSASLEAGIREIESRMSSEKERFAELIRENRASMRAKQSEWKAQLKSLQEDFQQKSVQAKEDVAREGENFEREKASLSQKEAAEKESLARQLAEWQAAQARVVQQIAREKEEWSQKLGQGRARVQELEQMCRRLEEAYAAERRDQAERVDKQRSWTEQRLSTLQQLLEKVRQDAVNQIGIYAREKNVVLTDLRRLREEFQRGAAAAVADLEARRKALDLERREAEAEHAAFLARSWDDEQKLKQEMDALEAETAALQKKLDVFRGRRERAIVRLRERHERILLQLHQEVDQVKVQGEARVAEERIALETMKTRLANRQARVAKIRQKQDEQLQTLFQELNATLDLVRQGHRSESQVWVNRLKSLRNQRDIWLKRRESTRTTSLISQEMQEKEKQELARFEQEEKRLRDEREQYWKHIVEYSAANQDALRQMMADLKGSDDLDRREALAVAILTRVREQLTHVRAFQNSLKPFNAEATIPNPTR